MMWLCYSVALFGLCYVIGHSKITLYPREQINRVRFLRWPLALIECPACFSFWIGLFTAWMWPIHTINIVGSTFAHPLIFAFLSCGSSAIIGLFTGLME